jgi:hypothetical protein
MNNKKDIFTSSDKIVCSMTPESHDQKREDDRKDNRGSPQTKNLAP